MPYIPEKDVIKYITADLANHYKIFPYQVEDDKISFLVDSSCNNEYTKVELELILGYRIELIQEESQKINQLLSKIFRRDDPSVQSISLDNNTDNFLLKIIKEAKRLNSSDIHIESYAEICRIRVRIDGKLLERYHIPKEQYPSFINQIKIKSKLDIAEKRLPQDGRILINDENEKIDIRVSVLPALYGEKIVLRLLNNDASHISLSSIGLDTTQLANFERTLKKPNGIILISGPTGSGKTTTLYATLKFLNNEHTNILTIEDPIEYTLDGVNQVQLKESIGLTFPSALRTFLRQDPDIIMLGEIRDTETAQMAIRSALTGHLVLSTIHTNSAWGTISRLIDMGVPPYLLANTINMTVAQRLIRQVCEHCKTQKEIHSDNILYNDVNAFLTDDISHHYIATGCDRCYYTGYLGRIAIYEVIPIDNELSALIKDNISDIDGLLKKRNVSTLSSRAIDLVKNGKTTIEEIYPILLNN